MVAFFILSLHIVAAGYALVSQKKKGGWWEGLLAVAFLAIIFSVGWTISTMLTNLLFTPEFFIKWYYGETDSLFLRTLRKEFNRDTIALVMLTAGEIVFYYFYLRKEEKESEEPATGPKKPGEVSE